MGFPNTRRVPARPRCREEAVRRGTIAPCARSSSFPPGTRRARSLRSSPACTNPCPTRRSGGRRRLGGRQPRRRGQGRGRGSRPCRSTRASAPRCRRDTSTRCARDTTSAPISTPTASIRRRGRPPARRGAGGPRRPRDRVALPRSHGRRDGRLPSDNVAQDRHQRLPLLPHPRHPPAVHRHDQRHARRQPPGDVALQRALLARLRRARVAAARGPPGTSGRGAPGAHAAATGGHLVFHAVALGLLHLQEPDRPPRRPVPAARRRGTDDLRDHPVGGRGARRYSLTTQSRILAARSPSSSWP